MAVITKKVKGTEDILPNDSYKWQFVEDVMRKEAECFGFKEIRTPVFEHTMLFNRGVGETTDVVQKEMYTFDTKGGESITLRPEGTAGAARAYLEHALHNDGLPIKAYYLLTCYRYEKAQAGRQREFHQFGMETYGAADPRADAEMICAANSVFDRLGIDNIKLELNSIGCKSCRKNYTAALKTYFEGYKDQLCETCLSRLDRNPMRILDCKSEICSGIAKNAPTVLEYICSDCSEHFEKVKSYLDVADIKYTVNPKIVRGLDYYTQPTPSLGFAMGLERLLMVMEAQGIEIPKPKTCDLYIAPLGEEAAKKAFVLVKSLREASLIAQTDIIGRALKPQMKYANKIDAKYSMVIGGDDLEANKAVVKKMDTHEQFEVPLNEEFLDKFLEIYIAQNHKNVADSFAGE